MKLDGCQDGVYGPMILPVRLSVKDGEVTVTLAEDEFSFRARGEGDHFQILTEPVAKKKTP